jgi:hypothetical protein
MIMSAYLLLIVVAFALTVIHAVAPGRVPLWIAVLLIAIAQMIVAAR